MLCVVWGLAASTSLETKFEALRQWVRNAGGLVDERLMLQAVGPPKDRGLFAREGIPLTDVSRAPLIVIPDSLEMNGARARDGIERILPPEARSLDGLDDGALCVLWLAHETTVATSFWRPYLDLLPPEPPCAWARSDAEVREALGFVDDLEAWIEQTRHAKEYASRVTTGLASDYGEYLGVDAERIAWALGMVASRSMGSTLVPLLDLVNHDVESAPFTSFNAAEFNALSRVSSVASLDAAARRVDGDDWSLWSFKSDNVTPRPLQVGDELTANYKCDTYDAFDWWLNVGFVPDEFLL